MIEIKLTCETVAEAQAEMAALLDGRPRVSISGSGLKDTLPPAGLTLPGAPTPSKITGASESGSPAAASGSGADSSSAVSSEAALPDATAPVSAISEAAQAAPSSGSTTEQPKRGRGRPRKDTAPVAAEVPAATSTAADGGNEYSGEASATAPAEPTSGDASSTSSENVTAPADVGNAPANAATGQSSAPSNPAADSSTGGSGQAATTSASLSDGEQPLVTDAELQRFCAKVASHFGGPQKLFDASAPFLAEGEVPRPTNIKSNADRWAFIRQMEAESGQTFHG